MTDQEIKIRIKAAQINGAKRIDQKAREAKMILEAKVIKLLVVWHANDLMIDTYGYPRNGS